MHRRLFLSSCLLAGVAACTAAPMAGGQQPILVFFTADSAGLDDTAHGVIAQAATQARANPSAPVRVRGFAAPDTGSAAFNKTLAQARAQNVADGLAAAGVPQSWIHIELRGAVPYEMMPTSSRRVDILIGS